MLTILETSKSVEFAPIKGYVKAYAESHPLLRVVPMDIIGGNAKEFEIEGELPEVEARGYNENWNESTGRSDKRVETLMIAGGEIKVDTAIVEQGGELRRATEESRKLKALGHWVGHRFIKGDSISSRREIDGLQNRVPASHLIPAGSTSGGDALSLALLDEAISGTINPNAILLNRQLIQRISQAARNPSVGGYVQTIKDDFGRPLLTYNGLPLLEMNPVDSVYDTLSFSEANPGGGSAVGTSIYVVSFGEEGVHGIHNGMPKVKDFGEVPNGTFYLTRVEWRVGLATPGPHALTRIWGIKNAAFVA